MNETKITLFLDYQSDNLDAILDLSRRLKLDFISLRKLNGKRLFELSSNEQIALKEKLNSFKITVLELDSLTDSCGLNDTPAVNKAFNEFKKTVLLANMIKAKYVYFRLPKITDFREEEIQITNLINEYYLFARKYECLPIIKIEKDTKVNIYMHLLNKFKKDGLFVLFDPLRIYQNNESTITTYRVLKKFIGTVSIKDIDLNQNPTMIGYGCLGMLDIFKKLKRDKFPGYISLDTNLYSTFLKKDEVSTEAKRRFSKIKSFFNKKKKLEILGINALKYRILKNRNKELEFYDVLNNQYGVLKTIFK